MKINVWIEDITSMEFSRFYIGTDSFESLMANKRDMKWDSIETRQSTGISDEMKIDVVKKFLCKIKVFQVEHEIK